MTNMPDPKRAPHFSQRREWSRDQAISFLMQQGLENPDVISLAAGFVDYETLPVELTKAATEKLLANPENARAYLQYGTTPGSKRLRDEVIKHLAKLEGVEVDQLGIDNSQVVLTTGSQQLLSILAEILFDPGDICLVAAPTYFVFLGVLAGVGAEVIAIEGDEQGIYPDALQKQLEELKTAGQLNRVKMVYLVSYYENPTGVSLAADRREQVVEIVDRYSEEHQIITLEDAAYRELRYDGPELASLWSYDKGRNQVVLSQTFSKSFAPGLRTGFGVLPPALVEAVNDRKGNEDFGSAHLNQNLLATVLEEGWYQEHVEKVRANYRIKRDAMQAAIEQHFQDLPEVSWYQSHGGLYMWMTLPERIETGFSSELFQRATQIEQVMYVPGELCYPHAEQKNQMRLSFGVQDIAGIDLGIKRLANAIRYLL